MGRGWRLAGTLFLNSSSSGVDSGTNTVTESSGLSTSGAGTSKAKFCGVSSRSRAVRFGGCIHERWKGFHCAWFPACAWVCELIQLASLKVAGGW